MKILIAVHHLPPHYTGGAEWRALRTARGLQNRGHQVQLVCVESITSGPDNGLTWVDDQLDGVNVRRLYFDLNKAPDVFLWQYDNPWIGNHLEGLIADTDPDIFHLFGGYLMSASAINAALKAKKVTFLSLTDYWYLCPRITMVKSDKSISQFPVDPAACAKCLGEELRRYRLAARVFPGIMKTYWKNQKGAIEQVAQRSRTLLNTVNQVNCLISPSEFLRAKMIEAGVSSDRIVYRRQGLDIKSMPDPSNHKSTPERLNVAYMGQISEHKGVHLLVQAIRNIPHAGISLSIYGDFSPFPEYFKLLSQIAGDDARIQFKGVYARDQLSAIFSSMDLIVVPSTWYENSPNVILEAFAHKVPVIASNLGAFPELVIPGVSGYLFEPNDFTQLGNIIEHALNNPNELEVLRQTIPAVKSLTQEIDEIETLYQEKLRR